MAGIFRYTLNSDYAGLSSALIYSGNTQTLEAQYNGTQPIAVGPANSLRDTFPNADTLATRLPDSPGQNLYALYGGTNGSTPLYGSNAGYYFDLGDENQSATLAGGVFKDILNGSSANDILIGNGGGDTLDGGGGIDTASYIRSSAGVTVDLRLTGAQVSAGDANGDTLSNFENLTGSAQADTLTGDANVNVLSGGDGNDRLDGGAGADVLDGGAGNDTFIADSNDPIIEAVGGGTDSLFARASLTLDPDAEIEVLATTSYAKTTAINLTGNEFDQTIYGNSGDNRIDGGGGSDTLRGGAGNDTYIVRGFGDTVIESYKDAGTDTVYATASFGLSSLAAVEVLATSAFKRTTAINLFGSDFGQQITGNAGNNLLDGAGGRDTLLGSLGNDTFQFTSALGRTNIDTISDFTKTPGNIDKIGLLPGLFDVDYNNDGTLASTSFVANATGTAQTADQHLVYNTSNGYLSYDADGSGTGTAQAFALLTNKAALSSSDFIGLFI